MNALIVFLDFINKFWICLSILFLFIDFYLLIFKFDVF